jgi:peptidoglycan/xylan/chitin deacetylase (PgdA/CDA1 family)
MSRLTIVMYHYVRDRVRTRYPGLKVRSVEEFEGQLDYLTRHYHVCGLDEVRAAVRGERALPANACLLTFDDGLRDHFTTVFPRLRSRGLPGSFYAPVAAIGTGRVLDTHKIQIIVAAAADLGAVGRRILDLVEEHRAKWELPSAAELRDRYAQPNRFDGPEVNFIKRTLQRGLPEPVRTAITAGLFEEHAGADEATVARELYLDLDELRAMAGAGMEVGGHGADHVWLDALPRDEQAREIERTAAFLARVYERPPAGWVMCYPFGAYNADTLALLPGAGCAIGLTTRVDVADLRAPLELARLDTNDLPLTGDAPVSDWTRRAAAVGAAA